MRKLLKYIVIGLVIALALYGLYCLGFQFVSELIDPSLSTPEGRAAIL